MPPARITRLRAELKRLHLDALLVTCLPHVRYLTNFTGSNGLSLVTSRSHLFFSDYRYRDQATREVLGAGCHITTRGLVEEAAGVLGGRQVRRVGFESEHLSSRQHSVLKRHLRGIRLVATTGVVELLASVKEPIEVRSIRKAVAISEEVYAHVVRMIRPGVKERDLAAEISCMQKRLGAEGDAFPPLVAAGRGSALPHARPSNRNIRNGQVVLLDFGCTVNGYHSDMTRTVFVGKASARLRAMYAAVLEARDKAVDAVTPGMRASVLDGIARKVLRHRGFDTLFVHSLGHGVGLALHERPRISPLSNDTLVRGNVVTIEPGVYRPDTGGIRIEDVVEVTGTGCRVLTTAPRELTIV